jgi:dihydroflavonol-4-reductase
LVLGATGQIGHALATALSADRPVRTLSRKPPAVPFPSGIMSEFRASLDEKAFADGLDGCQTAVYALGSPNQWSSDPSWFERNNVDLLRTFLRALERSSVRELIYVSTFEIFRAQAGIIREANGLTDAKLPPSFAAMRSAYEILLAAAKRIGLRIITLHPAAVYGGVNTAHGFTDFLLNLAHRSIWKSPAIVPGRFPLIHVESLAAGAKAALKAAAWGEAFILSDVQTSLAGLAMDLKRQYPRAYRPISIPMPLAVFNSKLMEAGSRLTGIPPLISRDHLRYLAAGHAADASKAVAGLAWKPMDLEEGVRRFMIRYGLKGSA